MAGGFDSLGLMPELIRAVSDMGYLLPSDVQDESIPLILGGGDVMVAAGKIPKNLNIFIINLLFPRDWFWKNGCFLPSYYSVNSRAFDKSDASRKFERQD